MFKEVAGYITPVILLRIREQVLKISQARMGYITGHTQAHVSRWERGATHVTTLDLIAIRNAISAAGQVWDDSWFFEGVPEDRTQALLDLHFALGDRYRAALAAPATQAGMPEPAKAPGRGWHPRKTSTSIPMSDLAPRQPLPLPAPKPVTYPDVVEEEGEYPFTES
jgi:hypothetical protein